MKQEVNETKVEKPINELTTSEALAKLLAIAKKREEAKALEDVAADLIDRINDNEIISSIELMSVEDLQNEIMKLDKIRTSVIKPFYERQKATLEALKNVTGSGFDWEGDSPTEETEHFGHHWQDERGIVWCTERVTGTFVEFRDFAVTRTRDLELGESKGLSMTKARKLGYVVEGK